jgi:hypothetical protein
MIVVVLVVMNNALMRYLVVEHIPMMTEEDVISLVVERHNTPTFKLNHLREESRKQPTDRMTKTRIKVVQHQLRHVGSGNCRVLQHHAASMVERIE